ncbi:MAG: hypothetical protein WAT25_05120 [Paracoccaceae bacterium]|jgi:hypothetical protein
MERLSIIAALAVTISLSLALGMPGHQPSRIAAPAGMVLEQPVRF